MISPGIEIETFQLVAEYRKQLRLRVRCELRKALSHVI